MPSKTIKKIGESFKHFLALGSETSSHESKEFSSIDGTTLRFPPKLFKLVQTLRFCSSSEEFDILERISFFLDQHYEMEIKDRYKGRNTLLVLWTYILKNIKTKKEKQLIELYKRILMQLTAAKGFYTESIDSSIDFLHERGLSVLSLDLPSTDSEDEPQKFLEDSKDSIRFRLHWQRLLLATFRYVTCSLKSIATKEVIPSIKDVEFFTTILAVFYVHHPFIQELTLSALSNASSAWSWDARRLEFCSSPSSSSLSSTKSSSICSYSFEDVLQERISSLNDSNLYSIHLDSTFLHCKSDLSNKRLLQEMNGGEWLKRIILDGEFLFLLIIEIFHYLDKLVNEKKEKDGIISLVHFPGYSNLIEISMRLLKECCFLQWWNLQNDSKLKEWNSTPFLSTRGIKTILTNSSRLFLCQELINCMLLALYESTNIYDTHSVGFCLMQLNQWFDIILRMETYGNKKKKRKIYSDLFFDKTILISGLNKMIATENFQTLKKILLFLYNRLTSLSAFLRQRILALLLQQHYRLFLHWNIEVRSYYHHILVYRIAHLNRCELDSKTDHLLLHESEKCVKQHQRNDNIAQEFFSNEHTNLKSNRKTQLFNTQVVEQPDETAAAPLAQTYAKAEKAYWKAFDACIAVICMVEREKITQCKVRHDFDLVCQKNKDISLQKLSSFVPKRNINEPMDCRPTSEAIIYPCKLTRLPYYFRYLPEDETQELKQLCSVSLSVRYRQSLRVYAYAALQEYSSLLKIYYTSSNTTSPVEGPPLGFC